MTSDYERYPLTHYEHKIINGPLLIIMKKRNTVKTAANDITIKENKGKN